MSAIEDYNYIFIRSFFGFPAAGKRETKHKESGERVLFTKAITYMKFKLYVDGTIFDLITHKID